MKNIGIFGIGAIGSIIIKYLNDDLRNKYYFFNRSERESVQIKFKDEIKLIQVKLTDQIDVELDWIIVCLKEYQYEKALPKLQNLIAPHTKVAIFQNGIHLASHFSFISTHSNILETIIDCPCQQIEPHVYLQMDEPKIMLPSISIADEFSKLLVIETEILHPEKFRITQWEKLIESSSLGSIQAKNKQPCSIFKIDEHLNEYLKLVDEGIKVALSDGVEVDPKLREKLLKKLMEYPENKGSSMLTDQLSGKPLELGAKIGAIVNVAEKNQINIPNTQNIYQSLCS